MLSIFPNSKPEGLTRSGVAGSRRRRPVGGRGWASPVVGAATGDAGGAAREGTTAAIITASEASACGGSSGTGISPAVSAKKLSLSRNKGIGEKK
jgi:hypothetical protein